jgi:hypothetical protein
MNLLEVVENEEDNVDNLSIYTLFNQEHLFILSYQPTFLMTCEMSCTICDEYKFLTCINLSSMLLHRK